MRRVDVGPELALRIVTVLGTIGAVVALLLLGVRATEQFDPSWDSLAYHLPFAALRAGIDISFEIPQTLVDLYNGAPPLPELLQGLIWRITGSVSATGLASYLALVGFAVWTSRMLRAPFWLVVLIPLTAPLVIIHATASYVDLITGVFFATGAITAIYLWLFPGRGTKFLLAGGLLALAAAFWSKYTVLPFAAALFLLYVPIGLDVAIVKGWNRRNTLAMIGVILLIAALPYLKNLLEYGNPVWPFRAPLVGSLFPYTFDNDHPSRPPSLVEATSVEAFVRSLFEIGLPSEYAHRTRWSIDSGGSVGEAFRMGGFWFVGVIVYLGTMLALLVTTVGRRGRVVAAVVVVTLVLVALIPQANELRYWMFIPLVWAGVIGMLFHKIVARSKMGAAAFGILVILMFGYMASENRVYYKAGGYTYLDAARATGARDYWTELEVGQTYCTVGMAQIPFLLTGPSLRRYEIIVRSSPELCPPDSLLLTPEGVSTLPTEPAPDG